MAKKPQRKRALEYEKKLAVDATFDELMAISLGKKGKQVFLKTDNPAPVKERKPKDSKQ